MSQGSLIALYKATFQPPNVLQEKIINYDINYTIFEIIVVHLTQSTIKIIINKTLNIFSHTSKDKSISAPNFLCTISKDSASMPS